MVILVSIFVYCFLSRIAPALTPYIDWLADVFDYAYLFWVYLAGINLIGFIVMGVDKKRAIRGAWRISEASLFLTAVLGGALGCILGMRHFRHKTKHWYFKYGMPAIFAAELFLLFWGIKTFGSPG